MFYHILYPLSEWISFFNIFKYITFRMIYGSITAFLIVYLLMPRFIRYMKRRQFGQIVREEGPVHHQAKTGTPTMGGVVIIAGVTISVLLWCNLTNPFVWLALFIFLGFGLIGFLDDYLKLKRGKNLGLRAREKLFLQFLIIFVFYYFLFHYLNFSSALNLPFFKKVILDLGVFYLLFASIVIMGSSNGVNLTDGLDGLAIVPFCVVAGVYTVLSYVAGHVKFANYLFIPYVPYAGELSIVCAILGGAGLGFLWYNSHPAEIFMGDVGSLSLGGVMGAIAVMIKQEFLLVLAGAVFVMEALSVILQVSYFKLTGGKRIFRMAPLHHHFELKGWKENKVVVRFWIISIICGLLALSTLKIR
ncbi:MAG: phospho-N-acetylmuramoyl-pentapeptide-transferase [Caldimicrobium sp.]|nr:phospho-N-acetylmuramoyl-pentapeptide-transferase [Caldimicrobium sp.]MCX7873504.1 phospho-N-acetylmuramoyl-pentapeptide-transferase [Caldimicrobium sp.]MDW8093830.1 phospho-N-acetylmuramoyl-pentapeptide-transferase [Caldimicrobium sp.]